MSTGNGRNLCGHADRDANPERPQGDQASPGSPGPGLGSPAPGRQGRRLFGPQLHRELRYGDGTLRSVLRGRRHPNHRGHEERDLPPRYPARLSEGPGERPVQVQQPERRQELRLRRIVLRLTFLPEDLTHGAWPTVAAMPVVSRGVGDRVWGP